MLSNHLKIAFRNLLGSRLFTALNVIGLTGGMVAAVFILMWVQNELSFDGYHKKADKIARVVTHLKLSKEETWHWATTPLLLAGQIRDLPEIESVTRLNSATNLPIKVGNRKVLGENAAYVDSNWFSVFDYQIIDGSQKQFASGVRNIAMTQSRAKQLFGFENAAGQVVKIDTLDYTVAAVFKDNPANSTFQYNFLVPLSAYLANPQTLKNESSWNNFNQQTFIVLRNDADLKRVGQKLTKIISEYKRDDSGKPSSDTVLEPERLTDMHFNSEIQNADSKGDRKTNYIFLGLATVILLVACINYVNLTTARSTVRSKEIGVKKLLGAGPGHLFRQFMTESILTCLAALLISLCLIYILLPQFNNLTGKRFEITFSNPAIWAILLGTTWLSIVLTGIYPSILLSSFKPFDILRGNNILGTSNSGFRKALVVTQFTVAVVFLISTLVVWRQIKFIRERELGYDRAHTFTFRLPWGMKQKIDPATLKARLQNESSIANITVASQNIVQINSSTQGSFDWEGRPKDFNPTVSQLAVEHNFQKMFGLQLREGRWFEANRETDRSNVILNEVAVKKLNLKKPVIGRRFDFQGKKGVVIGVVKDFHFKSLREKIEPLVLFNDLSWASGIYVKAHPGKDAAAIRVVEKAWSEMVPNHPFDYKFLDDTYEKLYQTEQRTATLFNTFTITAVLISCLGLFGLATFTAERRVKEIGIRKVLGASVGAIVSLLSRDFVILVLIAIVIASPVGYYFMNSWLQGFEYRIEINWLTFTLAALVAIGIAMITVSYQSIKAALMNPVKSLKRD
ncbi:ABC transporter permease [Dyadobacter aurulentus]|uniref:ABC transporter permease n=1 Tax=Dyadobacter sp. UC 10 TaxID=2605428 RepID=UPI0011F14C18|nr:ABC transporter permease [Dyadobacter sp. UC 10]KAA0989606.1 FtsX-like permease family protein [Dyadobacter sp. UC 10]